MWITSFRYSAEVWSYYEHTAAYKKRELTWRFPLPLSKGMLRASLCSPMIWWLAKRLQTHCGVHGNGCHCDTDSGCFVCSDGRESPPRPRTHTHTHYTHLTEHSGKQEEKGDDYKMCHKLILLVKRKNCFHFLNKNRVKRMTSPELSYNLGIWSEWFYPF